MFLTKSILHIPNIETSNLKLRNNIIASFNVFTRICIISWPYLTENCQHQRKQIFWVAILLFTDEENLREVSKPYFKVLQLMTMIYERLYHIW
jgi:hypothetical protein